VSQCFKLVNGGFVDKVIVIDTLPERLMKNIKTVATDGFPRSWAKWLVELGSMRPVMKTETSVDLARNWTFKHTPIGKEPCFFVLWYKDINSDKESWRNICDYLKENCGPEVRLKEKIEDMAVALSPSPKESLSIDTDEVPTIHVDSENARDITPEIVQAGETIVVAEAAPKKRGRKPKVREVVEA